MAARATVTLAYTGPALQRGEMDVRDLAPALLAAAGLVEESARVLYGAKFNVSVQVSATREGSFELDLALIVGMLEAVRDMITGENMEAIRSLAEAVFGDAVGGVSLLALIQWLRNRKGKKTAVEGGKVRLEIDGETIIVPARVLQLASDAKVRQEAEKMSRPLDRDGIDGLEVRSGPVGDAIVRIESADRPSFEPGPVTERLVVDTNRRMALSIVSLAFKENNKWRLSDGSATFHATLEDDEFRRRVDENLEQFAKDDYLVCDVTVKSFATASGLRSEYTITKVIEHHSAARQLDLGLEAASSELDAAMAAILGDD